MRCMIRAGADILGPIAQMGRRGALRGPRPQLFAEAAGRSGLSFVPRTTPPSESATPRSSRTSSRVSRRSPGDARSAPAPRPPARAARRDPRDPHRKLPRDREAQAPRGRPGSRVVPRGRLSRERPTRAGARGARRSSATRPSTASARALPGRRHRDTPRDVDAALRNGCRALGVATGRYRIEDLRAAGAHAAVASLEDPAPLWDILGDGAGTPP